MQAWPGSRLSNRKQPGKGSECETGGWMWIICQETVFASSTLVAGLKNGKTIWAVTDLCHTNRRSAKVTESKTVSATASPPIESTHRPALDVERNEFNRTTRVELCSSKAPASQLICWPNTFLWMTTGAQWRQWHLLVCHFKEWVANISVTFISLLDSMQSGHPHQFIQVSPIYTI